MAKMYVKSPQGTTNSVTIKIDSYYMLGTSSNGWTQWIVTESGFGIARGDFNGNGSTGVQRNFPLPIWAAVLITPYARPGRTGAESLTSVYYYCKPITIDDDNNKPLIGIKFFTNTSSTVGFYWTAIGEIALDF